MVVDVQLDDIQIEVRPETSIVEFEKASQPHHTNLLLGVCEIPPLGKVRAAGHVSNVGGSDVLVVRVHPPIRLGDHVGFWGRSGDGPRSVLGKVR